MRTNLVALAALAGLGLIIAGEAMADAKNLSCITEGSGIERSVMRDCDIGQPVATGEIPPEPVAPPPPPPPIFLKHDGAHRSGDGGAHGTKGGDNGGGAGGGNGGGTAGGTN